MGHTKTLVSRDNNCKICNIGSHRPLSCNMFRRMDPDNRTQAITKIAGCANSLSNYHKTNSCPSPMPCRFCRRRHHSMLHKHPESTAPVVAIATRDQPLQAMDGCFRSKSANPNDQQGVCVGPRPTAKYVRITRHSHCGNTRTNRKARKLSRNHRSWLSAKSHVQKDGRSTCSPHLQHITRYPRNWRNGAGIFVMGTRAAVIVKVELSEGDCCVYLTTTDEKPTVGIHR